MKHLPSINATILSSVKVLSCALPLAVFSGIGSSSGAAAADDRPATATPPGKLGAVLDSRPAEVKARYQYRHPYDTLLFFGLRPGMRVGEIGPGTEGWYTQIIAPYIGDRGAIFGINYRDDMWAMFTRRTYSEREISERIARSAEFPELVASIDGADGIEAQGFPLDKVPEQLYGTLDLVVSMRELHNPAELEDSANMLSMFLEEIIRLLKPGGSFGVVQHRAPEDSDDLWANGRMGYMKQSQTIASITAAGFEFIASSEINANPKDQPQPGDYVWRLPPASIFINDEFVAREQEFLSIGESDRMTLLFVKPI
ncbi:MAG: methyltransferase [Pseudomonadota bacterium]